jgi:multidrug resistance efflux pump
MNAVNLHGRGAPAMITARVTRQFEKLLRRCLAGIALLALTTGCQRGGGGTESTQVPAEPVPAVVVAEVSQQSVQFFGEFVARTEAVPTVEIRARVAGVLEQVRFREGSAVKQGQVLFVIQQEEYKAALQSARAQLVSAHANLERARDVSVVDRARAQLKQAKADLGKARQDVARYRPLDQEKAIPRQDLDTAVSLEKAATAAMEEAEAALKDAVVTQRAAIQLAEAAVASASASVTQADLNLKYTIIEAPISGMVGRLAVDKGNLVGQGESTILLTPV